jgi:hypothetical protein
MSFEQYLEKNTYPNKKGPDHSLRAELGPDGVWQFYIHPANEGGDTPNFKVVGNTLIPQHFEELNCV